MDGRNIQSGAEYATAVQLALMEEQIKVSPSERINSDVFAKFLVRIRNYAEETYLEYIKGTRESFMFTEEELSRLLDEAVSEYVNEGLESLVDKGLVGMGVREDGEIVYRLSEKGKQTAEKFR